jgi:hypothetical protein
MPACADKILGHNFTCGHLSCLCGLFDIADKFLLLLFELRALAIELALGFL